jgi:uncharacterized protein (TIGR03000 family)
MSRFQAIAAMGVAALMMAANSAAAQQSGGGLHCNQGLRHRCAAAGAGVGAPWCGYAYAHLGERGDPWLAAGFQPAAAPLPDHAGIRVYVPKVDAKVWIDGALVNLTGIERSFTTPRLPPGAHIYRIRVEWSQVRDGLLDNVVQERMVAVVRNQTSLVDFTGLVTEPIALPKQ